MSRLAVPFALCSIWFMFAWAIDKFWFTVLCQQCSALFAFQFSLKARELVSIETDRVSAIFLFALPFLLYAIALIPYRKYKSRDAWLAAVEKWSRPFFWLALVCVWVWLIESAYTMFSSSLPEWFKSYAEGYQLKISGTILGIREVTVNGKLGGLFGLILGVYLFLSKGMAKPG
jgi:hypothetical protein